MSVELTPVEARGLRLLRPLLAVMAAVTRLDSDERTALGEMFASLAVDTEHEGLRDVYAELARLCAVVDVERFRAVVSAVAEG